MQLMEKYYGMGYEVEDCPPPAGYKDYNEWLVAVKVKKKVETDRYVGNSDTLGRFH